jgi:D-alanyl-D-alanine carboxypeptidase (penicillin-binding protein 5/6)
MKKFICFLMTAVILTALAAVPSSALYGSGEATKGLYSDVYYLESLDEGTVFFDKDSDKRMPVAGFSKIISAVVALEKWENLDGEIALTKEALSVVKYGYGFRTALYKAGETVSKKELFDCLVIYSANDALSAIAYDTYGTEAEFINQMQALCDKIGCTSTVIKNITGYDTEGQYTTAADVAKIIKYAWALPAFAETFALQSVTLAATELNDERYYTSGNKMMNSGVPDYYHSSVVAGKYTMTDEAGECIAVISNKDGYSYISVVMGGRLENIDSDEINENTSMTDTKRMLDWIYSNIRYRTVVVPTQTVTVVNVTAGKDADTLRLVPESEISALVPANATPDSVKFTVTQGPADNKVSAPVKAGDIIAVADVEYSGIRIATVNLVAANNIEMSFTGLLMTGISSVLSSEIFILIVAILTLVAVAVFLFNLLEYRKRLAADKDAVKEQKADKKDKSDEGKREKTDKT